MTITLAQQVKNIIDANCPGTYSLYAGYGMQEGEYVRFPQGVMQNEKRNDKGRCTRATYAYADGSTLVFTWSDERGATLRTK